MCPEGRGFFRGIGPAAAGPMASGLHGQDARATFLQVVRRGCQKIDQKNSGAAFASAEGAAEKASHDQRDGLNLSTRFIQPGSLRASPAFL